MQQVSSNTLKKKKRSVEERSKIESFRIETPMGALESDSGNHMVDVMSVFGAIILIMILKKTLFGGK